MRVALLSALEPSVDDATTPRGLLRLGGRSIVHHQLTAALDLGCEKIVCLAEGLPGELIAVQHAAERAGAAFQIAADGRALARIIRPDDELLVFSDGLVVPSEAVATLLGGRSGVVVQPVESGLAAGYERIDLNHAGGGVLRMPGRLVAGLAELPGDWNPVSALLRIAVQSSLRQAVLPHALVDGGRWALVRSDAEAHRLEPQWLRQHTARKDSGGPGRWLAARLVERLGPALLHAGTRPGLVAIGAAVLALIALVAAWFGGSVAGFLILGLAWLVRRCAEILGDVYGGSGLPGWLRPEALFGWLIDLCLVVVAVWRFSELRPGSDSLVVAGFAVFVLIALIRLIPPLFASRRWAAWFEDRLLLALVLAAASVSQVFDLALMAGSLVLLVVMLVAAHDSAEPGDESLVDGAPERLTPP